MSISMDDLREAVEFLDEIRPDHSQSLQVRKLLTRMMDEIEDLERRRRDALRWYMRVKAACDMMSKDDSMPQVLYGTPDADQWENARTGYAQIQGVMQEGGESCKP